MPVDLLVVSEYDAQDLGDLKSVDEDSASPVVDVVSDDLNVSVNLSDDGSHVESLFDGFSIGVGEGAGDSVFFSGSIMPELEFGGEGDGVSIDGLDNGFVELVGFGAGGGDDESVTDLPSSGAFDGDLVSADLVVRNESGPGVGSGSSDELEESSNSDNLVSDVYDGIVDEGGSVGLDTLHFDDGFSEEGCIGFSEDELTSPDVDASRFDVNLGILIDVVELEGPSDCEVLDLDINDIELVWLDEHAPFAENSHVSSGTVIDVGSGILGIVVVVPI